MNEPLLIGVDVGSTHVKGAAFDLEARSLGRSARRYPTQHPAPGRVEQDPEQWWIALEEVIGDLAATVDTRRVAGLGICSQVNTHVFVDAGGEGLGPAISWQDQRCAEIASELDAAAKREFRSPVHIDASNLLARAAWLARNDPAAWEETRWIMSPKDYLNLRLTGNPASDALSSIGLVDEHGSAYTNFDALVAGAGELLPPLKDAAEAVGTTDGLSLGLPAGVPVAVSTMDAWGSVYGSGLTRDGEGFEVSGTSEILGVLGSSGPGAAGVVGFPPYRGLRLFAGPTQAGGDALRWFAEAHARAIPWALHQAQCASPGSEGLVFLPHLAGERAPLWDSDLRGAFIGLGLGHRRQEMCRAVLEGVAYSARHLLASLEAAAGLRPAQLALSGGGAISDFWCQIKADVLGLPLSRMEVLDSGVLGAALFAGVAAGDLGELEDAARRMVRVERIFEPSEENASVYEDAYAVYREAQAALRPVFRARAHTTTPGVPVP